MLYQFRAPSLVSKAQFTPESKEVYMDPLDATAASILPSAEEVMPVHNHTPALVRSAQVAPESEEV